MATNLALVPLGLLVTAVTGELDTGFELWETEPEACLPPRSPTGFPPEAALPSANSLAPLQGGRGSGVAPGRLGWRVGRAGRPLTPVVAQ